MGARGPRPTKHNLKSMPKPFLDCVKKGGRIRAKRINAEEYIKICYLGKKSYPGEVHKYKKLSFRSKSKK